MIMMERFSHLPHLVNSAHVMIRLAIDDYL